MNYVDVFLGVDWLSELAVGYQTRYYILVEIPNLSPSACIDQATPILAIALANSLFRNSGKVTESDVEVSYKAASEVRAPPLDILSRAWFFGPDKKVGEAFGPNSEE